MHQRWWEMWCTVPWPDKFAILVASNVNNSQDEALSELYRFFESFFCYYSFVIFFGFCFFWFFYFGFLFCFGFSFLFGCIFVHATCSLIQPCFYFSFISFLLFVLLSFYLNNKIIFTPFSPF